MKCPRCGSEIFDSSRFCKFCGEAVYCFKEDEAQSQYIETIANVRCQRCGKVISGDSKFCKVCEEFAEKGDAKNQYQGTIIGMRCPMCGRNIPGGSKFCEVCGEAVDFAEDGPSSNSQSVFSAPLENIKDYMVFSILVTIFCCPPFGIPAIVYSSRVSKYLCIGDIDGAKYASDNAKIWCIVALISAVVPFLLILIFYSYVIFSALSFYYL